MTPSLVHLFLLGVVVVKAIADPGLKLCRGFGNSRGCKQVPITLTFLKTQTADEQRSYCNLVCSYQDSVFRSFCNCDKKETTSTTTTTTTPTPTYPLLTLTASTSIVTQPKQPKAENTTPEPTTTPGLTTTPEQTTTSEHPTTPEETTKILTNSEESCYYTRSRPAKLQSVVKRMYSATPIAKECEYPGIVGVYNGTSGKYLCIGVLLEESKILFDNLCKSLVSSIYTPNYVVVESYRKPSNFTDLPSVVPTTAKLLDPTGQNSKVFTASLNKPVVFNNACVQPACFPNAHLPLSYVDLTDCRITGYGDTTDTLGSPSSSLVEVKVKVDPTTIASGTLKYTRNDGLSSKTGPCFNDQGAPLICNHLVTGEWVTIGTVSTIGIKCSQGTSTAAAVYSLLKESTTHNLYNGLQNFKYTVPV